VSSGNLAIWEHDAVEGFTVVIGEADAEPGRQSEGLGDISEPREITMEIMK
jgi:hypothetical protein